MSRTRVGKGTCYPCLIHCLAAAKIMFQKEVSCLKESWQFGVFPAAGATIQFYSASFLATNARRNFLPGMLTDKIIANAAPPRPPRETFYPLETLYHEHSLKLSLRPPRETLTMRALFTPSFVRYVPVCHLWSYPQLSRGRRRSHHCYKSSPLPHFFGGL